MNLFIFITFCIFATASPQYYYVGQPAVFHIPTTYNAFSHPFSTFHVNPHYQHQQFRTIPASIPPPGPAEVHRSAFQSNDAEYRGFAYHTRTDNGATSHVLFVTGPQAQQVNSRVFNNFNSPVFGQNNDVNHARTVASEMVDPVKKTDSEETVLPKNIRDLYAPPAMQRVENNDPFQYFRSVFQNHQNPSARLINFYSKNTDLFAQEAPGYPANVVPLPYNEINPRSLSTDELNNILNTDKNNSTESSTKKHKIEDKKSESEVAAESVITNTRFKLNDIITQTNKNDIDDSVEDQSSSTATTVILGSSTMFPASLSLDSSSSPSPVTQRAETFSVGTTPKSNTEVLRLTTSSSSSEDPSAIKSNSTSILSLSGPLNGTMYTSSPTTTGSYNTNSGLSGLLTQRSGNQPETRAEISVFSNDMPSSSSSDQSSSDNLTVSSTNPASQIETSGMPTQGLNTLPKLKSIYVQTGQDLISGYSSQSPVSAQSLIENESISGDLMLKTPGNLVSIDAITTSSSELYSTSDLSDLSELSESVSSTIYSSNMVNDTTTTLSEINKTSATTEYISTVNATTDYLPLTTDHTEEDNHLVDIMTKTFESHTNLARLAESSLDEAEGGATTNTSEVATSTAGNLNEENITITTDAMLTPTSP